MLATPGLSTSSGCQAGSLFERRRCVGTVHRPGAAWRNSSDLRPTSLCRTLLKPSVILPSGEINLEVKAITNDKEVQQVAKLRAEAYYEDDRSRYVESFKSKFARQEMESLKQRTTPRYSGRPLSQCLVAVDDAENVVGCLDVRLPRQVTGIHPEGVPREDESGAYVLNVVVREDMRGKGVGKVLLSTAILRARSDWLSQHLYTHVQADNEVACRLYRSCGFADFQSGGALEGASSLGLLLLLRNEFSK